MAVQWLHAAQAPVRPRHCTQALLQQPDHQADQLILSNTLPRPAARALFSLRLHSVSIAFRLCASSGESSARLRRFDWVFCALSRSWFEGVSSARLRRINWVFCARRRAASVGSVGWSGEVHPGGVVLPRVVGMMGPKCEGGIGQNDHGQTPHLLRYHLLGVLCWLYPVGYPRIYKLYMIDIPR